MPSAYARHCCGDPFTVGDRVTLQVRDASGGLRALLGGALGAPIDAAESHHEIDPDPPAVPRFSEEDAAGTPPAEPIIGYLVELDPC